MTDMPQDNERERRTILNALAESVAETSPEDLWRECREEGLDVESLANQAKTVIASAITRHKQGKLRRARAEYDARILSMGKRASPLPQSSGKRRELLTTVFAMKPDLRGVLTAAGREFHALTDEDVDLLLRQLQHLGVLDDLPFQQG